MYKEAFNHIFSVQVFLLFLCMELLSFQAKGMGEIQQ